MIKDFFKKQVDGRLERIPYLKKNLKVLFITLAFILFIAKVSEALNMGAPSPLDKILAPFVGSFIFIALYCFDVRRMKDILGTRPNIESHFVAIFLWLFVLAFPPLKLLKILLLLFTPSNQENSDFYKKYFQYSVASFSSLLEKALRKVRFIS